MVIATPTDTHYDLIHAAARAGKHVLCDKPLAINVPDAAAALEACNEAGVKLGVNFHYRHLPWVQDVTRKVGERVIGEVKADERAPGGVELGVSKLDVVQVAEPYPISKKEHGPDFLLSNRHLWIRSRKQTAILRIRDEVVRAIREFFHQREFFCADSPIFTPAPSKGAIRQ